MKPAARLSCLGGHQRRLRARARRLELAARLAPWWTSWALWVAVWWTTMVAGWVSARVNALGRKIRMQRAADDQVHRQGRRQEFREAGARRRNY